MEQNREFKGIWIDKSVWLDTRLNALEKIILMEIDSLASEEKGCYASNKYLSEFCQCSESKISIAVTKLINLGYLELESFDGRTRILKSRLLNFKRQNIKNLKADYEILKDNNINNNKDNNIYCEVLDYLNLKAETKYRKIESNFKFIKARLNDGFTIDDFKIVIDKKCDEWLGTEWEKYLTPETLFRPSNFEKYLNQKIIKKQTKKPEQRQYTKEQINNMYDDVSKIII